LKILAENADLDAAPAMVLPAGLAERQALREQIKKGLAQLAADGRHHYHPVEPETRRMKARDQNRYAYNAQAVADEKEGILVACDTTRQENDPRRDPRRFGLRRRGGRGGGGGKKFQRAGASRRRHPRDRQALRRPTLRLRRPSAPGLVRAGRHWTSRTRMNRIAVLGASHKHVMNQALPNRLVPTPNPPGFLCFATTIRLLDWPA
jgi:hypothetical protein